MNINARLICRFTSKMMRLQFTHLYQLIISLHLCLHLDFSEMSVSTVIFLFIRLLCALSPASVTSVTVASESNCATDIDETVMRQSNASCGCFKHTACSIIIRVRQSTYFVYKYTIKLSNIQLFTSVRCSCAR